MSKLNSRKSYFISPEFQLTFLGYMWITALVIMGSVFLANHFFFWKFMQAGILKDLSSNPMFFEFLEQQRSAMNWIFLVLSLFIFVFLTAFGLFFSHRIAGPIERFRVYFQNLKNGVEPKRFNMREGDFFKDLAEAYNQSLSDRSKK